MKKSNLQSEFEEFKCAPECCPTCECTEKCNEVICCEIRRDLSTTPLRVFSKLAGIHLISALLTLSVCPQFGFRAFGEGMGLMAQFMGFGPYGCLVACGSFFMGMSLFIASLMLKPYELLAIRRHRWAEIGSLVLLSLGFFLMIGAEEVLTSLTLAWLVGSFAGGLLFLELGWAVRRPRFSN